MLVEDQQFVHRGARFVVPAQHGEQADAERERVGFRAGPLEHLDRRHVVQQPDVCIGAEPEQRRVGSVRARGVQRLQHSSEFLLFQETEGLGQDPRIRLDGRRASPEQEDECERRHGRRFPARWPNYGVTVSETASSSPRNSSFEWKNQLRFAGKRSPPFSISPSRWMYSPSFFDSSW